MRDRTGQTRPPTRSFSNTFGQITANRYSSVGHTAALEILFLFLFFKKRSPIFLFFFFFTGSASLKCTIVVVP